MERYKVGLASRLKILREEAHYTQRQTARKLGIKVSTYSGWETGRAHPRDLRVFVELADLYDCSVDYLLGLTDERAAWLPCSGTTFRQQVQSNHKAKALLADYFVKHLVKPGDHLMLDMGSTLTVVADALRRSGIGGLRVASHSISAPLQLIESAVEYRQLGGKLHWRVPAAIPMGEMPDRLFPWSGPYKAIMTAVGFSMENGAATTDEDIARLNQRYMRDASEVIMLLDHSKFSVELDETTTMCGITPERTPWLKREKEFMLITEVNWDQGEAPDEYNKLEKESANEKNKNIEAEEPPDEEEFSSIRIFRSKLLPMKQQIPESETSE